MATKARAEVRREDDGEAVAVTASAVFFREDAGGFLETCTPAQATLMWVTNANGFLDCVTYAAGQGRAALIDDNVILTATP